MIREDMMKLGILGNLIRLTWMMMRNSKASVMANDEISKEFKINRGLRQGDGL